MFSSNIADVSVSLFGAESREEERERGEGVDPSTARAAAAAAAAVFRRGFRRSLSPGKDSLLTPVSSLPVSAVPG